MIKFLSIKYWLKSIELFVVQIFTIYLPGFGLFLILSFLNLDAQLYLAIFLLTLLFFSWILFAYYYDWGKEFKKHYKFLPSKKAFSQGYYDTIIVIFSNMFALIGKNSYYPIMSFIILWFFSAIFLQLHLQPTAKKPKKTS